MTAQLDEILAMADPVDVVLGLLEVVQRRIGTAGVAGLTETEAAVLFVYDLDSEVMNGGLIQYFANSSGDHARGALSALRAIGAPSSAEILERAIARLGPDATSEDRSVRCAAIDAFVEADYDALEPLVTAFQNSDEPRWRLLAEHCRRHADQFHLEPA